MRQRLRLSGAKKRLEGFGLQTFFRIVLRAYVKERDPDIFKGCKRRLPARFNSGDVSMMSPGDYADPGRFAPVFSVESRRFDSG